jgi:hypothetical protein
MFSSFIVIIQSFIFFTGFVKFVPEREDGERPVGFVAFDIGEGRTPEIVGPNASAFTSSVSIAAGRDIFVVPDGTQIVVHEIPA